MHGQVEAVPRLRSHGESKRRYLPVVRLGKSHSRVIGRWLKPLIVLGAFGVTVYWINNLAMIPEETGGSEERVVPGELSTQRSAAGPVCVPVVNPTLTEETNATQAVRREFEPGMRMSEGWVLASPAGGLWLTYMSATSPSPESGIIVPLNDQARAESITGTELGQNAPVYQGVTATDTEAVVALACAQGSL